MSAPFYRVQRLLYKHLKDNTTITVVDENRDATPKTKEYWIRADFLPGQPWPAGLGESAPNRYDGLMQLTLNCPKDKSWGEPRRKADELCDVFKRGTRLVEGDLVVTIEKSWSHHGMEGGADYELPVTVSWFCYADN